jgi:integrase
MPKSKRSPTGEARIINREGRLRIRIPRQFDPDNKQREVSLNIADTPAGRTAAASILAAIQLDLYNGNFDYTLGKYKNFKSEKQISIRDLWQSFVEYKRPHLKVSTIDYYERIIGDKLALIPYPIDKALDAREWLLNITTQSFTSRCLKHFSSAVDWGIRNELLDLNRNPYLGLWADIPKSRTAPANAFSIEERDSIIDAYFYSPHYDYYYTFVYFLFITGCRPSEAIGLQWKNIDLHRCAIDFSGSIVQIRSKAVRSELSKTNRARNFPINEELADLIESIAGERIAEGLVFPSRQDASKPIDYINFCHRGWDKLVYPIVGRKSTPYSCRDTFITQQIAAGVPIEVVAKWVDNSSRMIGERYFDVSAVKFIPR